MSDSSQGRALIFAAFIVGVSVVLGAVLVSGALDRTTEQIETAAEQLAAAKPGAQAPSGRAAAGARRPAPSANFDIDIGKAPVRGTADAPITIVEWSDFQCPFCARVSPTLARIQSEYGSRVRVVFKHLPLPNHSRAPAAHAASEAAHRQGQFWEMHDKIFNNPRDLAPETFERYASELKLDVERFKSDVDSPSVKKQIEADVRQAQEMGVNSTPAFFINGRYLAGAQPFENFKRMIDDALGKSS